MSGPSIKMAGTPWGGQVLQPSLPRSKVEELLGSNLTDDAWQGVERAFAFYGCRQRELTASKASKKKDDPQSWQVRQSAAVKAIEGALDRIEKARSKHGGFLLEASENFSVETLGQSAFGEMVAENLLTDAYDKLLKAVVILERAKPAEISVPTPVESQRMLVRDLQSVFQNAGLNCCLSTGWALNGLDHAPRFSDLTSFEQLIAAFGISDDKKPGAFAAWLRSAVSGGNQG